MLFIENKAETLLSQTFFNITKNLRQEMKSGMQTFVRFKT